MSCLLLASTNCHLCFNNTKILENLRSIGIGNDNIPLIQKFYYSVYKPEWLDTVDKNVPINICIHCRNALDIAYAFKKMCMKNSERLRIYVSSQQENARELIPASTEQQSKFTMGQDIQSEKFVSIPNAFEIENTQNSKDASALSQSNENMVMIDLTTEPEEQSKKHTNDSSNRHEKEDLSIWETKIKTIESYSEMKNNHKQEKRSQIEEPINKEIKRIRIVYEKSKNSNEARCSFEEPANRSERTNVITNKPINKNQSEVPVRDKQNIKIKPLIKNPENKQQTNETWEPLMSGPENENNANFIPLSKVAIKRQCCDCGVIRRNTNYEQLLCLNCVQTPHEWLNCAYCNKYFEDKSDLISHERDSHYECKCPYCDFTYFSKKEIQLHWLRNCNKDKKLHECDICKKTFKKIISFVDHRKTHYFQHMCDICGSKFQNEVNLRKHKINSHNTEYMKNVKRKRVRNRKKEATINCLPLTAYI